METLAEYVRHVIRGTPNDKAAHQAGISSGTMHYILSGRTSNPKPETLEAIAKAFGKNDSERRHFYEEMMRRAGYLEMLPAGKGTDQAREGEFTYAADYQTEIPMPADLEAEIRDTLARQEMKDDLLVGFKIMWANDREFFWQVMTALGVNRDDYIDG